MTDVDKGALLESAVWSMDQALLKILRLKSSAEAVHPDTLFADVAEAKSKVSRVLHGEVR